MALLAVAQMTSTDDLGANFQQVEALAYEAKSRGASLACFPENFAYIPKDPQHNSSKSQSLTGPLFSKYQALAQKLEMDISYGGFHELSDDNRHFNTHVVVGKNGHIISSYRKIHLFKVNIPNGPQFDETKIFTKGERVHIADSSIGRLGLSICFDVRFGELYQSLTHMGAQTLLVPSAFTSKTGSAHWEILLRARAIENQCYVAAAAQYGTHRPGRETHGHAMIVDPYGTIVAQCSNKVGIAIGEIDLNYLAQVRQNMPMNRQLYALP